MTPVVNYKGEARLISQADGCIREISIGSAAGSVGSFWLLALLAHVLDYRRRRDAIPGSQPLHF
jgi:hypothetical protein